MSRQKEPFLRSNKYLSRGIEMFRENNMSVYAGYTTLFIVTSLFPFIILIISIVNLLPWYSSEQAADFLFKIMPVLTSIRDLVESVLLNLKDQSGGLLASAAAVTALWAASKGVFALQRALNQLEPRDHDDETRESKSERLVEEGKGFVHRILKRLLFTLMLVLLFPALLVFEMLGASRIISWIFLIVALLVILLIYAVLPATRRTFKSQLPGVIFTVVCCIVFTELFSFFITRFYHSSYLYGSLATVFLVLMWLRYIIMILFAGCVLNRTLEQCRTDNGPS